MSDQEPPYLLPFAIDTCRANGSARWMSSITRHRTNRWRRAEPRGLLSTTCPSRGCLPPRQLYRYALCVLNANMRITVEYFFNYSDTLGGTGDLVNRTIGSSLSPYEGDASDLYCRFLGMELGLAETEFENDGDLNFQDYRYYLNFRTSVGAAPLRELQVPAIGLIAYEL